LCVCMSVCVYMSVCECCVCVRVCVSVVCVSVCECCVCVRVCVNMSVCEYMRERRQGRETLPNRITPSIQS